MNKTELINKIAEKTGAQVHDVNFMLNAFIDIVGDELKEGNKVSIRGFGNFEVREHSERIGRNPRNPEETIVVPAQKTPKFKSSEVLKNKINGK